MIWSIEISGIDNYLYDPYGYAVEGEKIYGEIYDKRYDKEGFTAAKIIALYIQFAMLVFTI